jgi:hypothetical protein
VKTKLLFEVTFQNETSSEDNFQIEKEKLKQNSHWAVSEGRIPSKPVSKLWGLKSNFHI